MTQSNKPELPWMTEAWKYNGLREIRGRRHNKTIIRWLRTLGAWWRNDEVPWCGTFVAICLKNSNRYLPKHWYRAKSYLNAGTRLHEPHYGCIAVMRRKGGYHTGFVVGKTKDGHLVIYGGNQGNAVNLRKFPMSRFKKGGGFVWPDKAGGVPSIPYSYRVNLPIYSNDLRTSTSEA